MEGERREGREGREGGEMGEKKERRCYLLWEIVPFLQKVEGIDFSFEDTSFITAKREV